MAGFLRSLFETADGRRARETRELRQSFISATSSADADTVKNILSGWNRHDIDGDTLGHALLKAAENNDVALIEILAAAQADVNFSKGAFYTYARNSQGHTYTITHPGVTPLMAAAKAGAVDAVEKLISLKADLDLIMENGTSALMLAAESGRTDTARTLLSAGADIHFRNSQNQRAVDLAETNKHFETLRALKPAYEKKPRPELSPVKEPEEETRAVSPAPPQTKIRL